LNGKAEIPSHERGRAPTPHPFGSQRRIHAPPCRASLTNFIDLADTKLDDYPQRLDQSDAAESKTGGSRVRNLAKKMPRSASGARAAE
jgi:hypothetical protein